MANCRLFSLGGMQSMIAVCALLCGLLPATETLAQSSSCPQGVELRTIQTNSGNEAAVKKLMEMLRKPKQPTLSEQCVDDYIKPILLRYFDKNKADSALICELWRLVNSSSQKPLKAFLSTDPEFPGKSMIQSCIKGENEAKEKEIAKKKEDAEANRPKFTISVTPPFATVVEGDTIPFQVKVLDKNGKESIESVEGTFDPESSGSGEFFKARNVLKTKKQGKVKIRFDLKDPSKEYTRAYADITVLSLSKPPKSALPILSTGIFAAGFVGTLFFEGQYRSRIQEYYEAYFNDGPTVANNEFKPKYEKSRSWRNRSLAITAASGVASIILWYRYYRSYGKWAETAAATRTNLTFRNDEEMQGIVLTYRF